MNQIELYSELYEYEKDSSAKMLAMLGSVPKENHRDARFQQAVSIAGHLAACRENWLKRMQGESHSPAAWYDEHCDFAALCSRFDATDARWTDFLARLDEAKLLQEFEFAEGDESFRLPTEVQIVQLFGHASYHRGQVALLVDQLGGKVVDTDYVDWWWTNRKEPADA